VVAALHVQLVNAPSCCGGGGRGAGNGDEPEGCFPPTNRCHRLHSPRSRLLINHQVCQLGDACMYAHTKRDVVHAHDKIMSSS
jgi:hypothetical protein